MWKYTHETIINSLTANTDAYESGLETPKVIATPGLLTILRAGEYRLEYIQGGRISKKTGTYGDYATASLNLTNLNLVSGQVYRLSFFLRMNHKYLADWATAAWKQFDKPVIVEFTAGASTLATKEAIEKALKLAIPYNYQFLIVTLGSGTTVEVKLTDKYAGFAAIRLEQLGVNQCTDCLDEYTIIPMTLGTDLTVVQNIEPWATGEWIEENLRFPSYPNRRYRALFSDEYPIPGALYRQYSFKYDSPRVGLYGMSGVNEKMEAVTTHIYYVLDSIADQFETLVSTAFGDGVIVEFNSVVIISAGSVNNDNVPVQLQADTFPVDSAATITWTGSLNANGTGNLPTGVTVSPTGSLQVATTVAGNVTFYVTATSSNDEYAPATKQITVIDVQ